MARNSFFEAPVASGLPVADHDVLTAKRLFKSLNRLQEPRRGFSTHFDQSLQDAIIDFQRERGLTVDGLITPGGPTERNLHRDRGVLPAEPFFGLADLKVPIYRVRQEHDYPGHEQPGEPEKPADGSYFWTKAVTGIAGSRYRDQDTKTTVESDLIPEKSRYAREN